MAAPKELIGLVERFERNLPSYTAATYNEAQARNEFIDPLFEVLGWDMQNKAGHAEAYKDVIHEDSLRVGGTTKAPDYCFRIGPKRMFFVEAKKPAVNIKDEAEPAFQLRRYAWSAKLPLSILTDFQELAVYDCRVRPEKDDKPAIARVNYFTFDQYPGRWDEIANVFSKEAVLKGSFDRFAEEKKGKRGTAAVDAEFLKEIERWRELLARNLALRNPRLQPRELTEAVQRTIDRIIFLRICEDRGIETQSPLQALQNGANVYRRLFELFQRADERYNSGLFHFQKESGFVEAPDTLTPKLVIDDKVLKDIIGNLYYPDSPYEFSVLPADVLGQVYEQFLGKVIRLTAGHQAKIEDKPEVKKAGGVYYTPTYIVDYIVEHTVGELLKGKTPYDVGAGLAPARGRPQGPPLRILDPACGSGSFLLGAYQRLLDWHRDWYVGNGPEKHTKARRGGQPALYQAAHGEWRLTTAERKRILLNSIFGVDIDAQAVEVTKLSLLLKVLEGETDEGLSQNLKLFHDRALPDLGSNIKCGNSLIGTDYYQGRQGELFNDEEALRVNAFDWDKGFPEIFQRNNPGFDAVIGNPPYINVENIPVPDRSYFVEKYGESGRLGKRYDAYQLFVMRGTRLLRPQGQFGMILPNTFLMGHSYEILRARLCGETAIREIVDLPQGVFHKVTVDNVLLFVQRTDDSTSHQANTIQIEKLMPKSEKVRIVRHDWDEAFELAQASLSAASGFAINVHANPVQQKLFQRVQSDSIRLGEITDSTQGIILYKTQDDARRAQYTGFARHPGWKKLLRGREIGRYRVEWAGEYVNYGPWLWCPREERYFTEPKILLQAMRNKSLARRLVAAYDNERHYNAHNLANIISRPASRYDLRYVLGLLNSRLLNYWYKAHFPNVNINPSDFRQVPIHELDFGLPEGREHHTRMVQLVDRMLALQENLQKARTDHEKEVLQRQLDATDREIDALVYELYGLTADEIRMVEEAGT
jgi:type I restriction-modification system DNA methylase subunit